MTKIAWRFRHTEYKCLVRVFKSWCLTLMSVAWWSGVVAQLYGVGLAIKRSRVRARLRNESRQVVHMQLPRRRHSSLVYRVVKLGTFTLF